MQSNLQLWIGLIVALDAAGTLAAYGPGASVSFPSSGSVSYVNGMADRVDGGFVSLEAAEQYRAKAIATALPAMATWANNVLPHKFAIQDACDTPELGLTDADKFSVMANCGNARTMGAERRGWWPQGFIATSAPGRLYKPGPVIPGYASFSSDNTLTGWKGVHVADATAIIEAAYNQALAAAQTEGNVHFSPDSTGVI